MVRKLSFMLLVGVAFPLMMGQSCVPQPPSNPAPSSSLPIALLPKTVVDSALLPIVGQEGGFDANITFIPTEIGRRVTVEVEGVLTGSRAYVQVTNQSGDVVAVEGKLGVAGSVATNPTIATFTSTVLNVHTVQIDELGDPNTASYAVTVLQY